MERESFVFYRSFFDSIKNLPIETRSSILTAIVEYALYGTTTVNLDVVGEAIMTLIKPQINANNIRYENGCKGSDFGKRGGRPRKTETETETENPKITPKKPLNNPIGDNLENPKKTPNENENENENENVNVNVEEEKNKKEEKKPFAAYAALADPAKKIIKNFCNEYQLTRGTSYEITNHAKEISAVFKIIKIYLNKNPNAKESQIVRDISDYLSQCLAITENWYFVNMSIPVISSKYNQINQLLQQQNGSINRPTTTSNRTHATTSYEAANIIAKHFANNYQEQGN